MGSLGMTWDNSKKKILLKFCFQNFFSKIFFKTLFFPIGNALPFSFYLCKLIQVRILTHFQMFFVPLKLYFLYLVELSEMIGGRLTINGTSALTASVSAIRT